MKKKPEDVLERYARQIEILMKALNKLQRKYSRLTGKNYVPPIYLS